MSDLQALYQEVILDHGRRPRNFAVLANANCVLEGFNPLCGDRLTVYIVQEQGIIKEISFQGSGCAISMASASLMTEALKGQNVANVEQIFQQFQRLVTNHVLATDDTEQLGKLRVLAGVAAFPARVKCATLAWHTMLGALKHDQGSVSTE